MSDDVKRPSRRGEQARATRRRIIEAASALFVAHGYAATTLESIAVDAGVAVQTVYFHFGNKATVLKEVVDVASVGDDEPVPLLERSWAQQIRDEPDPTIALAGWVAISRAIYERVAALLRCVRDAAGIDPEAAAQWSTNQGQRLTAHRHLADLLADKGGLGPGLSVDKAGDILFAILSPEVYGLVTDVLGWTTAEWERWVNSNLADTVLNPPSGQTHRARPMKSRAEP
jgi:AcrR family transcriptional regulator